MKTTNVRPQAVAGLFWACCALASTAAAGSVTIQAVGTYDKSACKAMKAMIVAADIAHMSDSQVCNFRFAQLPASSTKGFVFPRWEPVEVVDPVSTFKKYATADRRPAASSGLPVVPSAAEMASIIAAEKDRNLKFAAVSLKIAGDARATTFVSADTVNCRQDSSEDEMPTPALFAFNDHELSKQVPTVPSSSVSDGAQIALWKRDIPVRISMSRYWVRIGSAHESSIGIALMGWYRRKDGDDPEYIYAYPVCAFSIDKKD